MKKSTYLIGFVLLIPIITVILAFKPLEETIHPILQTIIGKFEAYNKRLPGQKIYLHLDKAKYSADETLWFSAYLLDATNHKPDSSTTNLYVEIISPSGYKAQSKLIRMNGGFGNGEFTFLDTIPEGNYKIRAFTNWMRNFNDDFFFEKEIYIANPAFSKYVTKEELRTIKKQNRKNLKNESSYDIKFLPEGGHLLAGVPNRIGFKVLNESGKGIAVSGKVFDSKQNLIAEFESSNLGMGSFSFTPIADEKYTAIVKINNAKSEKISMPKALSQGVSISVTHKENKKIAITVLNNFTPGQLPPNTSYFLLAHSRGKVVLNHEFVLDNKENVLEISENELPEGILHLTLFNVFSQPVSERLIFIDNSKTLKVSIQSSSSISSPRTKNTIKIKIADQNNAPEPTVFSVSIANSDDMGNNESILSNLLLNSDLRGKIENPSHYFSSQDPSVKKELDDLMLTQGWRRFTWANVMSDVKIQPKYENEKGILVTGKVTREFFAIPLRDIKVTLSVLNEFNDVFTTRTRETGLYRFEGLDYSDTVSVSIEAVRRSGRHNLILYVDAMSDDRDKEMKYRTNQGLSHKGEKAQWVEPTPEFDPYAERNNEISRLHKEPSPANVIIIDETNQSSQSVGQILEGRVPGVMITGNNVNIRGSSSMGSNTEPLFLVDGMPVDAEYALNMNPFDVERIEVLKGSDAAIYGSRGANGVIAIYTKRGKFMKKGILDFKMLGYSTPKEYYQPGFEYKTDDIFEDDRKTIFWSPKLNTNAKGDAEFSFYTSDVLGDFTIRLEGISKEGIPVFAETKMSVK